MEVERVCTKCGLPGEFGKRKNGRDGLKSTCKTCDTTYQKKWYAANPDKFKGYVKSWNERHPDQYRAVRRSSSLKRLYGLSTQDFISLIKSQDNKCAICHLEFDESRTPFVDHSHEVAEVDKRSSVRGLLCHRCNVGLGHFEDNLERLSAAIRYLTVFNEKGL